MTTNSFNGHYFSLVWVSWRQKLYSSYSAPRSITISLLPSFQFLVIVSFHFYDEPYHHSVLSAYDLYHCPQSHHVFLGLPFCPSPITSKVIHFSLSHRYPFFKTCPYYHNLFVLHFVCLFVLYFVCLIFLTAVLNLCRNYPLFSHRTSYAMLPVHFLFFDNHKRCYSCVILLLSCFVMRIYFVCFLVNPSGTTCVMCRQEVHSNRLAGLCVYEYRPHLFHTC